MTRYRVIVALLLTGLALQLAAAQVAGDAGITERLPATRIVDPTATPVAPTATPLPATTPAGESAPEPTSTAPSNGAESAGSPGSQSPGTETPVAHPPTEEPGPLGEQLTPTPEAIDTPAPRSRRPRQRQRRRNAEAATPAAPAPHRPPVARQPCPAANLVRCRRWHRGRAPASSPPVSPCSRSVSSAWHSSCSVCG